MSREACDRFAIPPHERAEHARTTSHLLASARSIYESGDGFLIELPAQEYVAAAEFVARERLCCPFLRFVLEAAPGGGSVTLRLEGPPGTVHLLRAEFQLLPGSS